MMQHTTTSLELPVSVKKLLWMRGPLGVSAEKAPNQGVESSFCCCLAGRRLLRKECVFD